MVDKTETKIYITNYLYIFISTTKTFVTDYMPIYIIKHNIYIYIYMIKIRYILSRNTKVNKWEIIHQFKKFNKSIKFTYTYLYNIRMNSILYYNIYIYLVDYVNIYN